MKPGWESKTLGEIAAVKGGKRVPKGYKLQSEPTEHPYLTISDFTDDGTINTSNLRYVSNEIFEQIKQYTISCNDLYLSIAGTIGRTGYVPPALDGASLTENACKLILRPGIDLDYLLYFTKSRDFTRQAGINTRTAAQPKLALERLKSIELPVPDSLAEQRRIVGILDEAFAGIAVAKQNAQQNLQNARALFESHLDMVFAGSASDWTSGQLADCLELITYGFTNPMPTASSGPYMVTAKNVVGGRIDYESARRTTQSAFDTLLTDKSRPKAGDVLLTKDGTLGRVAVVDRADLCINQSVALLRPNGKMLAHFMRYLLSSPTYQRRMVEDAGGATIKHIYITRVDKMEVLYPSTVEQSRILTELDLFATSTNRLRQIYQQKLTALDELKKSLLAHAFAGELTSAAVA